MNCVDYITLNKIQPSRFGFLLHFARKGPTRFV
nr:MAG TPA: hypothetical protein [Caudoviricetes sp.]